MLNLVESLGAGPETAACLAQAAIGATALKGRAITEAVRQAAKLFGEAFAANDDAATVIALNALGLCPDDVLPPNDAQLNAVLRAGRRVGTA